MKFAAAFLGHLLFLAIFFWWTGMSDDSKGSVALGIAVGVIWLIAILLFEIWLFRGARWGAAFQRPRFWAAVALVAASVVMAKALTVTWIPNVPGLSWQLTSFVLRFGLAWTLLNAAWVHLARQAGAPPAEDRLAPAASQ